MTFGIPDPGKASKAVEIVVAGASPFDAGRIPCPQGGEDRWSSRWLMERMAYSRWEDFEKVIQRAKQAAHNEGFNINVLFRVFRSTPKNSGGRPQADYHVTRYAAYLIAASGDTRKPECAAALHYFVVRTREAELAQPVALDLTDPDTALDKIIELATLAKQERAGRIVAEAKVAELEPSAVAWDRLHELGADVEVADAAKILSRDDAIEIGRNRLFEFMYEQDWIFRGRHNCWKAYQEQVDLGRLMHRPGEEFWCKKTERYRTGDPTILVTPKGIAELRRLLGGMGQLELVSA